MLPTRQGGWRQPPKRENAEKVREVYNSLFFPSYLSFPLEGKSREAGKGVGGRAPIGCSIAVLTANRRPCQGSTVSTGYSATVEVLHRTSKWGAERHLNPQARQGLSIRRRPLWEYRKAHFPPTGIYRHSSHLLFLPRSFVSLRMTSGRRGSPATSHQPLATLGPKGRKPSSPKGPSTITSACPFHKIIK